VLKKLKLWPAKRGGISVRTLLSLATAAALLPFLLLAGIGISIWLGSQKDEELGRVSRIGENLGRALDRELRSYIQAAEIVAGSQYLRDGDIATIRAIARDTARRLGGHFVLMDRSGRHLINTRLEPPAQLGTTQNSRPLDAALAEAGFEIAHTAASVRGALRALPAIECDVAVLDVNLRGESIEPVALTLRDRRIPYLFATGYGSDAIPTEFADARVVPKPVDAAVMAREIMRLLNT